MLNSPALSNDKKNAIRVDFVSLLMNSRESAAAFLLRADRDVDAIDAAALYDATL